MAAVNASERACRCRAVAGDSRMPEEVNRIVTDALADLLLTPSADADENLVREGIARSKIHLVGNVMIDSLIANLPISRSSPILKTLGLEEKNFVYVTLHRPANVDAGEKLHATVESLVKIAADVPVVFAVHPRTAQRCRDFGIPLTGYKALRIVEPLGYHDSLRLTETSALVLTDSGGLQEESTYFRTPCLTLRPNTERPVTLTLGSNRLTSLERLSADVHEALGHRFGLGQVPPLWDGQAAPRIVTRLLEAG